MRIAIFWDVAPCGSCKNRCFHHRSVENQRAKNSVSNGLQFKHAAKYIYFRIVLQLKVTANVPCSQIDFTLIMELPPKRLVLQEPRSISFQKTVFFIVTAVKTSKLCSGEVMFPVRYVLGFYIQGGRFKNIYYSTLISQPKFSLIELQIMRCNLVDMYSRFSLY
jgi:hypothetical protein